MRKLIGFFLVVLIAALLVGAAHGQNNTFITGKIQDQGAQAWSNAHWTASLVNPMGGTAVFLDGTPVPTNYSGTLDDNGNFTGSSVLANYNNIVPPGTSFTMSFCPVATAACQTFTSITVRGTSVSLGVIISPGVTSPVVQGSLSDGTPVALVYAYNLNEIVNQVNGTGASITYPPSVGSFFWNGAWTQMGGDGASGVTSFNTRTGAVVPALNDYGFSLLSGVASNAQIPWASPGDLGTTTPGRGNFTHGAYTGNGAASDPGIVMTGHPFTGGTGTTTGALMLIEDAASTTWDTTGTYLGINSAPSFTGSLIDIKANNASVFRCFAPTSSCNFAAAINAVGSQQPWSVPQLRTAVVTATPGASVTFNSNEGINSLTLNANVTSSALGMPTGNAISGAWTLLHICQPVGTGPFTFVPPTNVKNFTTISAVPGNCSDQMMWFNGSDLSWIAQPQVVYAN